VSRTGRNARREAVRGLLTSARRRLQRSWLQDLAARLKTLDFFNAIVLFGAALLMSVLPLIILLSSAANQRVDDDLSRHRGLSRHGAQIIEGLFRKTPAHEVSAIVTGVIVGFAGTLVFGLRHRGWRDFPRFVIWAAVLIGALAAQALYDVPLRSVAGAFVRDLVSFALVTIFFMWSMYFPLAGRVAWHRVMLPAFLTAIFWLGLALFSTIYFAPAVISEQRLYGTIGVVLVLLTWFIAIGAVVVLGATLGAVLQERAAGARGRHAAPPR
jgi:membrane protein